MTIVIKPRHLRVGPPPTPASHRSTRNEGVGGTHRLPATLVQNSLEDFELSRHDQRFHSKQIPQEMGVFSVRVASKTSQTFRVERNGKSFDTPDTPSFLLERPAKALYFEWRTESPPRTLLTRRRDVSLSTPQVNTSPDGPPPSSPGEFDWNSRPGRSLLPAMPGVATRAVVRDERDKILVGALHLVRLHHLDGPVAVTLEIRRHCPRLLPISHRALDRST